MSPGKTTPSPPPLLTAEGCLEVEAEKRLRVGRSSDGLENGRRRAGRRGENSTESPKSDLILTQGQGPIPEVPLRTLCWIWEPLLPLPCCTCCPLFHLTAVSSRSPQAQPKPPLMPGPQQPSLHPVPTAPKRTLTSQPSSFPCANRFLSILPRTRPRAQLGGPPQFPTRKPLRAGHPGLHGPWEGHRV